MFGWRKKDSGPTREQLREAYLKMLAAILEMHERDFVPANVACPPGPGRQGKPVLGDSRG